MPDTHCTTKSAAGYLDERQLHVGRLQLLHELAGNAVRHNGIANAMYDAHRTGDRDEVRLVQQHVLLALF